MTKFNLYKLLYEKMQAKQDDKMRSEKSRKFWQDANKQQEIKMNEYFKKKEREEKVSNLYQYFIDERYYGKKRYDKLALKEEHKREVKNIVAIIIVNGLLEKELISKFTEISKQAVSYIKQGYKINLKYCLIKYKKKDKAINLTYSHIQAILYECFYFGQTETYIPPPFTYIQLNKIKDIKYYKIMHETTMSICYINCDCNIFDDIKKRLISIMKLKNFRYKPLKEVNSNDFEIEKDFTNMILKWETSEKEALTRAFGLSTLTTVQIKSRKADGEIFIVLKGKYFKLIKVKYNIPVRYTIRFSE